MVPPDYFHMIKPASDPNFPWTGIFFGAPILGIWYWCTDQVIVQRVLSARDEGHAKAGTIFAGFLKILPVFMLVLPGIIAKALFRDQLKSPDFAYPTLVLNLLPVGLVGLVMAALLAAVMGAMSSVFNSASTLVTLDFYKKLRPQVSERELVRCRVFPLLRGLHVRGLLRCARQRQPFASCTRPQEARRSDLRNRRR